MTWKEWKEAIERLGVKDEDEVEWIDAHGGPDPVHVHMTIGTDGKAYWEIA